MANIPLKDEFNTEMTAYEAQDLVIYTDDNARLSQILSNDEFLRTSLTALTGFEISGIVSIYADLPAPSALPNGVLYLVLQDETYENKAAVYELKNQAWAYAGSFGVDADDILSHIEEMKDSLAKVATSGSYNDLSNKPTIPPAVTVENSLTSTSTANALSAAQGKVLQDSKADKSSLKAVATSGSYNDLTNRPTIPAAVTVENNLTSTNTANALSAAQGKVLQDSKEPKIAAGTTAQYLRGDKTWQTLNAAAVGLGNVPNINAVPVTGGYIGDGTTNRTIVLGFAPRAVLVMALQDSSLYFEITENPNLFLTEPGWYVTGGGQQITSTGFTVNSSGIYRANKISLYYNYAAWR